MDPVPPLSRSARSWLVALADPAALATRPAGDPPWSESSALFAHAGLQGVLPAALRNFAALVPSIPPDAGLAKALADARAQFAGAAGFALLLSHHGDRLLAALHGRGLRAFIVKGPIFARRIYPDAALRGFTDIDILVHPADRAEAGRTLAAQGFLREEIAYRAGADYAEDKWLLAGQPNVMIELHTNLVHNPRLRQALHLDYDAVLQSGGGDPEDANALLLIAAVHGSCSHQFDRLQHLTDVLLLGRGAAGRIDIPRLRNVADRCRARFALAAGLVIAAAVFADANCARLAQALADPLRRAAARALIGRDVVLESQTAKRGRNSWRRKALRQLLRFA